MSSGTKYENWPLTWPRRPILTRRITDRSTGRRRRSPHRSTHRPTHWQFYLLCFIYSRLTQPRGCVPGYKWGTTMYSWFVTPRTSRRVLITPMFLWYTRSYTIVCWLKQTKNCRRKTVLQLLRQARQLVLIIKTE